MKLVLEPGLYVVAVSGGVDSMVLLDVLRRDPAVRLIVAHFDHGIRPDSEQDRQLVEQTAGEYGLPFVAGEGKLGSNASEAVARAARYRFLREQQAKAGAKAIITAHHQDDVLETAVLNLLRGTGRKGLSSLKSDDRLVRPLLGCSKQQLQDYATEHKLHWREDATNQDTKYLRNYVRLKLLAGLSVEQKQTLLSHINRAQLLNQDIDELLQIEGDELDRQWFIDLPHAVAREVMATWLRNHQQTFDSKALERLVTAAKTLPVGKRTDITKTRHLYISKHSLALKPSDR